LGTEQPFRTGPPIERRHTEITEISADFEKLGLHVFTKLVFPRFYWWPQPPAPLLYSSARPLPHTTQGGYANKLQSKFKKREEPIYLEMFPA
jgi:hypothetical protein